MWRYFSKAKGAVSGPEAAGCCDRCGDLWALRQLRFQHQWRGESLFNLQIRVCPKCYDVPSAFLKTIRIPADPIPVYQPRPPQWATMENNSTPDLTWDQLYGRWDDGVSVWDPS